MVINIKKRKRKKKKKRENHFVVPVNNGVKLKESGKRDKYIDLARELKKKKAMEPESDDDTNCN